MLLPAFAIAVPLLLVLGVLLAQLLGGAAVLPVVRRTLGGLGLGPLGRARGAGEVTTRARPERARPEGRRDR